MTNTQAEMDAILAPASVALADAHEQWHDMVEAYHDPDGFRRAFEGLVQTLRNVTFRLQSAKSEMGGDFDRWYGEWQSLMRDDPQMKWLNETRVAVTKRGGVSPDSFARVRYIDSYLEPERTLLRVPANTPTERIATKAVKSIPFEYRQHVAIEITRRWVPAGETVETEISETCAHGFRVLDALLTYAREMLMEAEPECPADFLATIRLPECMLVDPSHLPLLFEADTLELTLLKQDPVAFDPEIGEEASKRYRKLSKRTLESNEGFVTYVRGLHEVARTIYKRDKVHYPIVHLHAPDGTWEFVSLLAEGKRDKFLMWHNIGSLVLAHGYDAVVSTNEVWAATISGDPGPFPDVQSMPSRTEELLTVGEQRDGDLLTISSPIFRQLNRPFLKASSERSRQKEEINFLAPVRRAWQLREDLNADGSRTGRQGTATTAHHVAPPQD